MYVCTLKVEVNTTHFATKVLRPFGLKTQPLKKYERFLINFIDVCRPQSLIRV